MEGLFKLDMIEGHDRFVALTENNVNIINSILKIDSSYRNAFSDDYPGSSANLIKTQLEGVDVFPSDRAVFEKIMKQIDKENSTHFIVSGTKKDGTDNNQGFKIALDTFMEKDFFQTLKSKLMEGDSEIVNEIATVVPGRDNFSFATKFCHYISYNALEEEYRDNYSIYDKVLSEVIPFYYQKYVSDDKVWIKKSRHKVKDDDPEWMRRNQYKLKEDDDVYHVDLYSSILIDSLWSIENGKKHFHYDAYRKIIDSIIEKTKTSDYKMTRNDFDHLLWYYYKGDEELRRNLMKVVYEK